MVEVGAATGRDDDLRSGLEPVLRGDRVGELDDLVEELADDVGDVAIADRDRGSLRTRPSP